jgi:hypothetical protein
MTRSKKVREPVKRGSVLKSFGGGRLLWVTGVQGSVVYARTLGRLTRGEVVPSNRPFTTRLWDLGNGDLASSVAGCAYIHVELEEENV